MAIVQYIKVLTSLGALSWSKHECGWKQRASRREKHMVPILVWWLSYGSLLLWNQNPAFRLLTTSNVTHLHGWVEHGGRARDSGANLLLAGQELQNTCWGNCLDFFFFILHVSWFAPVLSCAQPAYHYKTSGPYCITDGADRRERRQPACFLERRRVCSWVRVEGGIVRNNGTENFICLHQGRKKKIRTSPKWFRRQLRQAA